MRLPAAILAGLVLSACGEPGPPDPPVGLFTDVTADLGIDFAIDRSVAGDYFMPDSMGTGCALLDYDDDGDLDLYLVNGYHRADGAIVTDEGANRLYRQEPDGLFRDVSADSGADDRGYGMGVAVGDIDNDGDLDLLVTNYGPNALYRNAGDGTFADVTAEAGIEGSAWSSSAGFVDYNGDGFLDLYVANYVAYDERSLGRTHDAAGRPEYASPGAFPGVVDVLYRNDGDGTFTDVTRRAGIARGAGRGLGVSFLDLDGDDRVDIYVANDGDPNFAWINVDGERFEDRAPMMGLAVNRYGLPEASMGLAVGDADGDGFPDIFATHLVRESNTLYRRTGPDAWEDATRAAGLASVSLEETGFGTSFLDADLDGDLDLAVVNGRVLRRQVPRQTDLNAHWAPYAEPNQLLVNDGTGSFSAAGTAGGAFGRDVEVSRGLAVGDVDADGRLDLVVVNGNGTLRVYRNGNGDGRHWLVLRVIETAHNRDAVGAIVEVDAGGATQQRIVAGAGSYLSHSDLRVHFGLGAATKVDAIRVRWPDGTAQSFGGVAVDQVLELRRE